MKYLIIMLLFLGTAVAASAQHRDRDDYGRRRGGVNFGITIGTSPYGYNNYPYNNNNGYYRDRNFQIEQINREFNQRIWDVRNDYNLAPWEKRRIIRNLEIRREERINELSRMRDRTWDY